MRKTSLTLMTLTAALAGVALMAQQASMAGGKEKSKNSHQSAGEKMYSNSGHDIARLSKERIIELARKLTQEQRKILLTKGTEAPFCGGLLDNKEEGVYTCALCGLPLFSSDAKFKSGTGWPSFFQPVDPDHIENIVDKSLGMVRTEINCQRCGGHLGHVFEDGPKPTGLRYCLNSAALEFHKKGDELPPESQPVALQTAYFAGGCFWGVEDRFQQVPGVVDAVSGYQNGHTKDPSYREVCSGQTGHAEAVRVTFDPRRVSYEDLLGWFFKFHDATQLNRQGPDYGEQYRSAIFAANDDQLREAKHFVDELQKTPRYRNKRIVTQIAPAGQFYEAEEYHQDYHAKHGGSCAIPSQP